MPVSREALVLALLHPEAGAAADASRVDWTGGLTIAALLVAACVYAWGSNRRRAGRPGRPGGVAWRPVAFAGGWAALALALVSPVDTLSAQLSSAHMVQHELLMLVAAPLIVAGTPLVVGLFVLPLETRKAVMRVLRRPAPAKAWTWATTPTVVWLLHAVAVWGWHLPVAYDAALGHEALHAAQHGSFFVSAVLFWWGLTRGRYGRMGYGAAVVYVFGTALHTGLLGAALTLSPVTWYDGYLGTTAAWGLSPIEDQQLAGLIMWIPAGVVFTAMGLVYFAAWLHESERRVRLVR